MALFMCICIHIISGYGEWEWKRQQIWQQQTTSKIFNNNQQKKTGREKDGGLVELKKL